MGIIVQARKFSGKDTGGMMKPIIYCCPYGNIAESAVPLNDQLARALSAYRPKRRTMQIEKIVTDIISRLPEDSVIKDFDVLFNPDYKIDVLKVLVNVCKNKPFSIVWPGTFDGGRLVYAEEGYQDYKTYSVDDYDVTCIV